MDDTLSYDALSRLLLGSLFKGIAADVAVAAPPGARLLEVGCGPGHLSVRLARDRGFEVTGLDLDPSMVERARANAACEGGAADGLRFEVGDVAALPFADQSFDVVVSTMSMHHWDDPQAGLAEIARVLRPGGRALIWDLLPGGLPFHRHVPDPLAHALGSGMDLVDAVKWHWPWRFSLAQRIEFVADRGRR